jgi:hypothetical protein
MNSRQRRQQRVYEHEITLVCHNDQRYFEFDRKVELAKGWLQWRTKRRNYVLGAATHRSQIFKFRDAGMAAMFALKFL